MHLTSNKGFSLPEVIIALGILGGMSIITMKLIDDQVSNEAFVRANVEISKTLSTVQAILNNPENCRYTMKDSSNNPLLRSSSGTVIPAFKARIARLNADKILIEPNKIYPNFKTGNFLVRGSSNPDDLTAQVELNFFIRKKSIFMWGRADDTSKDNQITRTLPLMVNVDGTNRITDCGPVISNANQTAMEKFCESMGSLTTWNGSTCQLVNQTCDYNEVPETLAGMAVTCVPIRDQIDLSYIISQGTCVNTGGGFRIQTNLSTGQLELVCM